jgi:hypothetical protein
MLNLHYLTITEFPPQQRPVTGCVQYHMCEVNRFFPLIENNVLLNFGFSLIC